MRTIPNISHQLEKIDELTLTKFIPAITGGIYVNTDERYLLSLPANMMVWDSQYFQSLQLAIHESYQKIYETKLLSKNEQAVNYTTRK